MYVDFKITMADILSNAEMGSFSDISVTDESTTSEDGSRPVTDGSRPVADGSGSEDISAETSSNVNISEETLVDESGNSVAESLRHIDSTLTIILIVILLIWVSNHLHIVAKTFGKIGKGE